MSFSQCHATTWGICASLDYVMIRKKRSVSDLLLVCNDRYIGRFSWLGIGLVSQIIALPRLYRKIIHIEQLSHSELVAMILIYFMSNDNMRLGFSSCGATTTICSCCADSTPTARAWVASCCEIHAFVGIMDTQSSLGCPQSNPIPSSSWMYSAVMGLGFPSCCNL